MVQKPVSIQTADFSPYGQYWRMDTQCRLENALMTRDVPMERPLRFGITVCENRSSFSVDTMERHLSTEEILFAGDSPILLSIADSDPSGLPQAEDVVTFLMEPGDLVVLKRGIWHDACHALNGTSLYYFLSYSSNDPNEITWKAIQPAPIQVKL